HARCPHCTNESDPCQVARSSDWREGSSPGIQGLIRVCAFYPLSGIAVPPRVGQTARTVSTRAQVTPAVPRGSRLGERLRQLRVSAGLTQSDLAGERFSKEYISQIERGKTRPTPETVEWLAKRLGVDPTFLATGVSTDERARAEAILARAETLTEKRD